MCRPLYFCDENVLCFIAPFAIYTSLFALSLSLSLFLCSLIKLANLTRGSTESQMERSSAAVHSQTTPSLFGSSFAYHLKPSPSQLEFQECLEKIAADGEFRSDGFFSDVCSGDLSFAFKNRVSHFPSVHLLLSSLTCPITLLCHMSAYVSL